MSARSAGRMGRRGVARTYADSKSVRDENVHRHARLHTPVARQSLKEPLRLEDLHAHCVCGDGRDAAELADRIITLKGRPAQIYNELMINRIVNDCIESCIDEVINKNKFDFCIPFE